MELTQDAVNSAAPGLGIKSDHLSLLLIKRVAGWQRLPGDTDNCSGPPGLPAPLSLHIRPSSAPAASGETLWLPLGLWAGTC